MLHVVREKLLETLFLLISSTGLPWCLSGKEPTCQCRRLEFDPLSRKIHMSRATKFVHCDYNPARAQSHCY